MKRQTPRNRGRSLDPFTHFVEHPAAFGESYIEHGIRASRLGGRMLVAGVACLIHAMFPFVLVNTASRTLRELHSRLPKSQSD